MKKRPKHPPTRLNGIKCTTKGGVNDIRYAVSGVRGEVRILYSAEIKEAKQFMKNTSWKTVDAKEDFTRQFKLTGLQPNTKYDVIVETRGVDDVMGQKLSGQFKTAPTKGQAERVVFTVSTGQTFRHQDSPDGFEIYPSILKLKPSFFVHTGDIVYYDGLAKSKDLAHWHWQRMYSLPTNADFHTKVVSYFIKDDHDTWKNDCWPDMKSRGMYRFTFKEGYKNIPTTGADGPGKTIWGAEQKTWFKQDRDGVRCRVSYAYQPHAYCRVGSKEQA